MDSTFVEPDFTSAGRLVAPGISAEQAEPISYSQNAEDVRLWRVFKHVENGFYVDVGAADPTVGSITRLFYDRGWSGINVEPSPAFERLSNARPRDINVRAAIGESEKEVSFFLTYPDLGMSTLDVSSHAHVPEAVENVVEITIPQRRLETVLREHASDRTIHFLKIDVEGAEREVIASSDWTRFRPIVAVVESVKAWSSTPTHHEWAHILEGAEYEFAVFDGVNRFYVAREHRDLIPALAYPISALDRFVPAAQHELETRLAALEETRDELATELEEVRRDLQKARGESEQLRQSLEQARATAERAQARVDAVYRSRTWRAGRAIALAARPAFVAASRTPLRHVVRSRSAAGMRPERPLRPAEAYAAAVASGEPWHFDRRSGRGRLGRAASALERPLARFGKPEVSVDAARAVAIADELRRIGWSEDESLLSKRLSWHERQAAVEAEAVVQLVLASATTSSVRPPSGSEQAAVVVDARCLQEAIYRTRGVGAHARTVLAATRAATAGHALVLMVSAELPPLDAEVAAMADRLVFTTLELRETPVALFIELSPMTASVAPAVPFLAMSECATAAVVYDFIPTSFPAAYLRPAFAALTNRARLEALRHYDLLLPISKFTEAECRRILGDRARTCATGVGDPLRVVEPTARNPKRPLMVVPAGGDPRKNTAAAIAALASHRAATGDRLRAVVTGALTDAQKTALDELRVRVGLSDDAVELRGAVSELELSSLYAASDLVIVPSFAEGFSIPLAEALRRGTPVVASDIPVHRELVGMGPWLAAPVDVESLSAAIGYVRRERSAVLQQQQAFLGDMADPDRVRARTASALEGLLASKSAGRPPARRAAAQMRAPRSHARPRLALVAPFPPQRSGIADYTAFTFRQVARYADVEVYTAAPTTNSPPFTVKPLSAEPYVNGRFDAVINVVGNSHFHFPVLDLMGSYGGACIAHDTRMVEAYRYDRGDAWTAELLSTESRVVLPEEIEGFLFDLDRLPSLGYDVIARQASPLVVHGRALADRVRRETGASPIVVPFVPYNVPRESITEASVRGARASLGLDDSAVHVATFGIVDRRTKAVSLILGASGWLHTWGISTHLHIVGDGPPEERQLVEALAQKLDIGAHVTLHGHVSRRTLEQFLLGVDVAVQLRTSSILSLSGALADCIAFGVPTVTTQDVADELDAPSYVSPTASSTSSLLVAERIVELSGTRKEDVDTIERERADYLRRRSADAYARGILEAVGVAPA